MNELHFENALLLDQDFQLRYQPRILPSVLPMLEKRFSEVQVLLEFFNMTSVKAYNDHFGGEQASPPMMTN